MFRTILLLSYTLPAIYLFFRIWQLFIGRRHRFLYILIFAALFMVYPFSNIPDYQAPGAARILEWISGYLIPFFLYVFLLVLLTDILLVLNLIVRFIPKEKIRQQRFRNRYFAMVISVSIMIVIGGIINFNTIRTSGYRISVEAGKSELKNLKIAFVSDFHLEPGVSRKFVESYVKKIRETGPDLLLYGGDILEGSGENIQEYEVMLKNITPPLGAYGVLGNHDRLRNLKENFFTRAGITLLNDTIMVENGSFVLVGRLDHRNKRKSINEHVANTPGHLPLIVIDHRPIDIDMISRTPADISFSGHTHNGQLFPLNLYMKTLYEISYGYMKKGDTHFFVSSGIRLWGPPVRTTGRSEIVVVDVVFEK